MSIGGRAGGGHNGEVVVTERVRPRDLVLFTITAAAVIATPWMMISAGTEMVSYRDSNGADNEAPAWMGPLIFVLPLLVWSWLKLRHLVRRPVAATAGPGGIRLFAEDGGGMYARHDKPDVDLPWEEVERVVVWRIHGKWLGFIPVWEARVGVEKTTDWYGVSQKEPNAKQRQSREVRPDGTPVRLGAMLNSRSIRLASRGAVQIAAATARFAPGIEVVDERFFGAPRAVKPKAKRDRKTY